VPAAADPVEPGVALEPEAEPELSELDVADPVVPVLEPEVGAVA
jgi:hypothetical protein